MCQFLRESQNLLSQRFSSILGFIKTLIFINQHPAKNEFFIRMSSEEVSKSADNARFKHIYWSHLWWDISVRCASFNMVLHVTYCFLASSNFICASWFLATQGYSVSMILNWFLINSKGNSNIHPEHNRCSIIFLKIVKT